MHNHFRRILLGFFIYLPLTTGTGLDCRNDAGQCNLENAQQGQYSDNKKNHQRNDSAQTPLQKHGNTAANKTACGLIHTTAVQRSNQAEKAAKIRHIH